MVPNTYFVIVTDHNGCTVYGSAIINNAPALPVPICMVTADSGSVNNVIYWEHLGRTGIDSIIVYRYQASTTTFLRIGAVPFDSTGKFTDTERYIDGPNGGDPNYHSYRYAIKTLDTCGNLSAFSDYHESVFMSQTLQTFNFNQYTINGAPINSYQLYIDVLNNGNWQPLGSSLTSSPAADPNYTQHPNARYRIDALGFNCDPNRASTIIANSNIKHNNVGVGITVYDLNSSITIAPNPFTSQTTISFSELQKNTTIKIMDVVGKEIKTVLFSGKSLILEKGEMQSGVYFVQITDDKKNVVNKKVVVE